MQKLTRKEPHPRQTGEVTNAKQMIQDKPGAKPYETTDPECKKQMTLFFNYLTMGPADCFLLYFMILYLSLTTCCLNKYYNDKISS